MTSIREEIIKAVPEEKGRVITLTEKMFRGKDNGNGNIQWVDATPPSMAARTESDIGKVIVIDHDLLSKELCIDTLAEALSSRMVKFSTVSVYVMTPHDDPRADGKEIPILKFTTGTPECMADLLRFLAKTSSAAMRELKA